jgi:hypothetical protein
MKIVQVVLPCQQVCTIAVHGEIAAIVGKVLGLAKSIANTVATFRRRCAFFAILHKSFGAITTRETATRQPRTIVGFDVLTRWLAPTAIAVLVDQRRGTFDFTVFSTSPSIQLDALIVGHAFGNVIFKNRAFACLYRGRVFGQLS